MAKNVTVGDGLFSIGDYSFPKSAMFLQVRDDDFVIKAVASDSNLTFKFDDLADAAGDPFSSKATAVARLKEVMFLPEVVLTVEPTP